MKQLVEGTRTPFRQEETFLCVQMQFFLRLSPPASTPLFEFSSTAPTPTILA